MPYPIVDILINNEFTLINNRDYHYVLFKYIKIKMTKEAFSGSA
jgi:hypothetical protein